MENFTPLSALIGGSFIGLSAVIMLAGNGRIAGISGILRRRNILAGRGEALASFISRRSPARNAALSVYLKLADYNRDPSQPRVPRRCGAFGWLWHEAWKRLYQWPWYLRDCPLFKAFVRCHCDVHVIWFHHGLCYPSSDGVRNMSIATDQKNHESTFAHSTVALLSGLLFGLGLIISGMANPGKVIGFLDLAGDWDPSLLFVMGGGVAVTTATFWLVLRRERPLFEKKFFLPTKADLDGRLLIGAALFGIGWGIGGLCPGPAITALATLDPSVVLFVGAMLLGMVLQNLVAE